MKNNNHNNPITKKELVETLGTFTEDVLLPAVERIVDDKLEKKLGKHTHEIKSYVDSKLAEQKGDIISYVKVEHTREMKSYIESKFDSKLAEQKNDIIAYIKGEHTQEMKTHIDVKLAEQKNDIIAYIKGDRERDNSWKLQVVDILKRHKLAKPKELELLTNFIK